MANASLPTSNFTIHAGGFLMLAAVVAYGIHVILTEASDATETAQQLLLKEIAKENRDFCEQFAMGYGTPRFRKCSEELAVIRQKQTDRDHAAAEGIL